MKYLGIDYGEKRIGLAYGDELGVAVPVQAAIESTLDERLARIETEIRRRSITALVVGYPYNMDGTIGFKAKEVDIFISELEKRFGLPVHRTDERLTTHAVEEGLRATGRNVRADRRERATGNVDSRAAALILQDFLDINLPPLV